MKSKIAIISGATIDYYDRLLALYKSLRFFHKNIYFICYLIADKKTHKNFKNELQDIFLSKKDKYLIYKKDKIEFENEEHKRGYSTNVRIKYLVKHYPYYDCVFWMDADTIILKNIDSLFKNFSKYKVTAHDKRKDLTKILAGVIGFKKSKKSKYILNNWYDDRMKKDTKKWMWNDDQLALIKYLNLALKKYSHQKEFYYKLPYNYISWSRNPKPNHYIIVGKGSAKFNKKYLDYQNKFSK